MPVQATALSATLEIRSFVVGSSADIPPGQRKIINVPGIGEVGVFNIRGEFFAVRNVCPHQGGPMCRGKLTGTTRACFIPGTRPELEYIRDGEILRCPWHAWEFDIRTGEALFGERTRVVVYDVHVEGGEQVPPPDNGEAPGNAEIYPVAVQGGRLVIELGGRRASRMATRSGESADAG